MAQIWYFEITKNIFYVVSAAAALIKQPQTKAE